jgi:hypothetical protein
MREAYPSWQEAIIEGREKWSFTPESFAAIGKELDALLAYSNEALTTWIPKVCSGLPHGSPESKLATKEFIAEVRGIVTQLAVKQ